MAKRQTPLANIITLGVRDFARERAFYRRLGYEVIGELPGWPGNNTRVFLRKRLV